MNRLSGPVFRKLVVASNHWTGRTRRLLDRRGEVLVLMYHRIIPDGTDTEGLEPGMFVRATTFDRQLGWLGSCFAPATLGHALTTSPNGSDRPSAILTFDDGWLDNLTVAWPILQRRGMRATVFLVADWISAGTNGKDGFLRPNDVRALAEAGMEFGAHTASHPRLDLLGESEIEREMRLSREAVEDWTGRPCSTIAYPYGAHNERAVRVAARLFQAAVVAGGGWWRTGTDPFRIPRVGIHEDMTATRPMFEARLAGLF